MLISRLDNQMAKRKANCNNAMNVAIMFFILEVKIEIHFLFIFNFNKKDFSSNWIKRNMYCICRVFFVYQLHIFFYTLPITLKIFVYIQQVKLYAI